MTDEPLAFTHSMEGLARVLTSPVDVYPAFDPKTTPDHPTGETFNAVWDTGATGTVISPNVVAQLGLAQLGFTKIGGVHGAEDRPWYLVNIGLPNGLGIPNVQAACCELLSCDVLVGMDIIGLGDFAVTNKDGNTMFSFRTPSLKEIDFVVESWRRTASRNGPCPCGSGKKFKRCHGA